MPGFSAESLEELGDVGGGCGAPEGDACVSAAVDPAALKTPCSITKRVPKYVYQLGDEPRSAQVRLAAVTAHEAPPRRALAWRRGSPRPGHTAAPLARGPGEPARWNGIPCSPRPTAPQRPFPHTVADTGWGPTIHPGKRNGRTTHAAVHIPEAPASRCGACSPHSHSPTRERAPGVVPGARHHRSVDPSPARLGTRGRRSSHGAQRPMPSWCRMKA